MAAREGSEPVLTSRTSLERVSDRELVITRTIGGPARIVFEAWTRPEHVSRWWAPQALGAGMASCDAEVRVGGSYRYVVQHRRGGRFAFSGEYREIRMCGGLRRNLTEVQTPSRSPSRRP